MIQKVYRRRDSVDVGTRYESTVAKAEAVEIPYKVLGTRGSKGKHKQYIELLC